MTRLAERRRAPARLVERRRALARLAALALVTPLVARGEDAAEDRLAREVLERADRIRFPVEGFEVEVAITTTAPGQEPELRRYKLLSKGNENTIVMATEPASERGQIMLMKSRDLWIFLPTVSQPVRLALSQRLTGQVANGDLARANFSGDYTPRIVRTEPVDGEPHYVLELAAVDRGVTYHRVLLWVRQSNYWPHRAEFYALSDRLLKTCTYQGFREHAGRVRPTRLVMEDALRKGEQSVLEYSGMRLRDLPDKIFTRDYLKRLE
jgi:outer membrane lipoprotein-sorting protein